MKMTLEPDEAISRKMTNIQEEQEDDQYPARWPLSRKMTNIQEEQEDDQYPARWPLSRKMTNIQDDHYPGR